MLIKHSPNTAITSAAARDVTFLVKSSTPYVAGLKRITKMLLRPKTSKVVVKGMGRAIEKTISIGATFDAKVGYRVEYRTGSVEVLDEIVPDKKEEEEEEEEEEDEESVYKKRMVSYVEVTIYKERTR